MWQQGPSQVRNPFFPLSGLLVSQLGCILESVVSWRVGGVRFPLHMTSRSPSNPY